MTKTQSDFGVQLDSLADVMSFGAAPALLVYKWALASARARRDSSCPSRSLACGALRLARFNVLAARGDKGSSRFFVGLPIPLAAGAIVALVIAHYRQFGSTTEASTRVPMAARGRAARRSSWSPPSATGPSRTCTSRRAASTVFAVPLRRRASPSASRRAPPSSSSSTWRAYIAMGLAESHHRAGAPRAATRRALPAAVRAELDADEALEPDDEDVESDKDAAGRVHLGRDAHPSPAPPRSGARAPPAAPTPMGPPRRLGPVRLRARRARHVRHPRRDPALPRALAPLPGRLPRRHLRASPRSPPSRRERAGRVLGDRRRLANRDRRGGGLPRHPGARALLLAGRPRRLRPLPHLRRPEAVARLRARPREERLRRGGGRPRRRRLRVGGARRLALAAPAGAGSAR